MRLLKSRPVSVIAPFAVTAAALGALSFAAPAEAATSANTATAVKAGSVSPASLQACGVTLYRPTNHPIQGKARLKNCAGWTVQLVLQVHRWDGWERIADKRFSGKTGYHNYTIKACKKGTYTYRMYATTNDGPQVRHFSGPTKRMTC
ncbi:hypothetical protein GCM10029978_117900 [Actinoallomurus acanthiterrae]